jgi:hypothetical protein
MLNIYDFTRAISALIQINEPVLHVADMDTKKLNYSSYLILMCHVNYVNEKDINLKSYELNGVGKISQMY